MNSRKAISNLLKTVAVFSLLLCSCRLISPEGESGEIPDEEDVFSIEEARNGAEGSIVWVEGFVIGGDLSSKSMSFTPPFKTATNLAISPGPDIRERDSCLSVQLPKGALRDSLNLVDHPELLGRHIYLKGELSGAYFGLKGLKNPSRYLHSLNH